jgi:hypothetical protein
VALIGFVCLSKQNITRTVNLLAIARLSLWGIYSCCLLLLASAVEFFFLRELFKTSWPPIHFWLSKGLHGTANLVTDISCTNVVDFQTFAVLGSWVNEVLLKILSFTDDRFVLLDPGDGSKLGACSFNRPSSESTLFEPQLQPADLNKEFVCLRSCLWATSPSLPHLIFSLFFVI